MPDTDSMIPSILILDDDELLLGAVTTMLAGLANVATASTADDARAALHAQDFDFVLSDVNLPGFNGYQVHAWLAVNRPGAEQRMLFITGDAGAERAREFAASTGIRVIEKPFDKREIRRAVGEVMAAAI